MASTRFFVALLLLLLLTPALSLRAAAAGEGARLKTNDEEVSALYAIRDSLTNAVDFLPTWMEAMDPCGPMGWFPELICNETDTGYTVVALSLRGPLTGSLSPRIVDLPNLKALSLAQVAIDSSSLPSLIMQMTQLTNLRLWSSAGSFNASQWDLSKLPNLEFVSLRRMGISGPLSDLAASALPKLDYLDVGENKLTGSIPSDLPKVSHLDLSSNSLSGAVPSTVLQIPKLRYDGNAGLCGAPSIPACSPSAPKPVDASDDITPKEDDAADELIIDSKNSFTPAAAAAAAAAAADDDDDDDDDDSPVTCTCISGMSPGGVAGVAIGSAGLSGLLVAAAVLLFMHIAEKRKRETAESFLFSTNSASAAC